MNHSWTDEYIYMYRLYIYIFMIDQNFVRACDGGCSASRGQCFTTVNIKYGSEIPVWIQDESIKI